MMDIVIPSSGRHDRALTPSRLPPELAARAIMLVPHGEGAAYAGRWQNVMETPADLKGIAATRQWILDNMHDDKLLMLDDDLRFDVRRIHEPSKFLVATFEQVTALFVDIERQLSKYLHLSVTTREGGNRLGDEGRYFEVGRSLRALGYRRRELNALRVRFDRLPLMEDMDVTLQLLRLGHPNLIINYAVQGQGQSNAPGGCSQYRDQTLQARAAQGLAELHRPHVRLAQVETKGAWWAGVRTDVEVQWKQAFKEGELRAKGIEQKELF